MRLKRRCFDLLGIRPYDETWADGLQVCLANSHNYEIKCGVYVLSDSAI
jgi:hypothetical protein